MKINLKEQQTHLATFEKTSQVYLDPNKLIAIRLDMRAGGSFVSNLLKPWDYVFTNSMIAATKELIENVSGVVAAYTGSDEITLVLYPKTPSGKYNGEQIPFFNGRTDKLLSITSSIATNAFNKEWFAFINATREAGSEKVNKETNFNNIPKITKEYMNRIEILENKLFKAQFDSRVFQVDGEMNKNALDVIFSRMNDVKKNSIQMLARNYFSHKQLQKKSTREQKAMLAYAGIYWDEIVETENKYGTVFYKSIVEKEAINKMTGLPVMVKRNEIKMATENELIEFVEARTYPELYNSILAQKISYIE